MNIIPFSSEYSSRAKSFVIDVLAGEGFAYDPQKDPDLDDIEGNYIRKGGIFFISLANGEVVGTSAVRDMGSGACEIKRLYVRKECRGRGLGLALFRTALDFAEKHHSKIKLKTDPSLRKAISIYLGHGFVITKKEGGFLYFEKSL
ncbi:GNAT family N-acetyltransferase [Methanolobus halotolerans]|uniref:N-acetyltransferase n=1 Tax=Methanolobus halotolerans TaxID=2052935 RepID=A0A4E0R0D4_9EURY|nr:GNAT family N-acetyltransferase [Methanolobus halotolerans]TGC09766.1 N-acetyltransferase [Methanolobus halotolerans]